MSAYANSWFDDCRDVYKSVSLLFLWLNHFPVSSAAEAAQCSRATAVDVYSMAREICEVIMSNEITSSRFGVPGIEMEVDKCFLTRHKYHKGRRLHSGTITLFGIYEHESNLGCHFQVKDRSQAVLISEIQRFIAPGTHTISDGMASYRRLLEYGYDHCVVIHDKEFVNSKDTSIHTQNIV